MRVRLINHNEALAEYVKCVYKTLNAVSFIFYKWSKVQLIIQLQKLHRVLLRWDCLGEVMEVDKQYNMTEIACFPIYSVFLWPYCGLVVFVILFVMFC